MQQITITVDLTPKNLDILKQLCSSADVNTAPVVEHPVSDPFPEPQGYAVPQSEAPKAEGKLKLTAADVKAVCLKYSKAGRQSELKAAFAKFGAKKLTEISEDDYPALMEELGNE